VQISSLRKVLGPHAIATIPGRGYRFSQRLEEAAAGEVTRQMPPSIPAAADEALPALLGREEDLSALERLILAHRLVTVVGAGGIGKTTVARALAQRARGAFADGVCIAELAPVSDASLVATTVASALQVKLGSQFPVQAIAHALSGRCRKRLSGCSST
jgi:type II secretory pathway predicted ATPase ExeA